MAVMRYVVRLPTLAEASDEQIIAQLGPVLQHYLVDSLGRRGLDFIT